MIQIAIMGLGTVGTGVAKVVAENILRCLLGSEPKRLALCRKYFSVKDLMDIKKREIGTGCIGGRIFVMAVPFSST